MKILILITVLSLSGSSFSQTRSDKIIIAKAIVDYTKEWKYKLKSRYSNRSLLDELELLNRVYKGGYIKDSLNLKYKELLLNDTLVIEGYFFCNSAIQKLAERTNKRVIPKVRQSHKLDSGIIKYSVPIFSIDKNIALVFVQTYCGPLCGSGEIFILERKQNTWQIKDRLMKSIS
jgi:hypothetical protein